MPAANAAASSTSTNGFYRRARSGRDAEIWTGWVRVCRAGAAQPRRRAQPGPRATLRAGFHRADVDGLHAVLLGHVARRLDVLGDEVEKLGVLVAGVVAGDRVHAAVSRENSHRRALFGAAERAI